MSDRRYDTTPTDRERTLARAFVRDTHDRNPGLTKDGARPYVLGYISGTVQDLTEVCSEDKAREVARARAVLDEYEQGWRP